MRVFNKALFLLVVLFSSLPASAIVYKVPTDAELVQRAAMIVEGEVSSASVTASGAIETLYKVELRDVYKGRVPARHITVALPGGIRGDQAFFIGGAPSLR